jgi:uncharacterized protein YndB with AHSA1/START domain
MTDGGPTINKLEVIAEPGKQEIVMTRVFDAPRALVFRAYTEPALIAKWWGPRRFSTTIETMEAKAGGSWRFVHRDTHGAEYAFHGVYHDVVAPERIVQTFEFEGEPGHVSLDTMTFEDEGGRTKLLGISVFQTVDDRDGMVSSGMEGGLSESMDRLGELLATMRA